MAAKMKPVLLGAVATMVMLPALAKAQTQSQSPPARPAPDSTAPLPTPNQPAGTISPSDPVAPGSQPAPPAGSLGNNEPVTETAQADAEASASAADIVVTGFRSSLQAGIDLKREAITFRDSIVAEDIGKFPENNIAESLQRIPGVELVRDGNSNEGSTIQLRGLPSTFTVTTFNGAPVYTTSGGGIGNASRTFNYDVFPSELFGRADVYKAPLAELTEGGIAGVVDLRTPRPFDQKEELTARYAVSVNNNSQSGSNNPRGNALISARSGNFGALIAVAGARTTNGRAGFQSTGTYSASSPSAADIAGGAIRSPIYGSLVGSNFNYNFAAPGINLNGATQQQIRDAILPRFFVVNVANNVRERFGTAASLQYKDDSLDISLDGLYSVVTDDDQGADIRFPIRDSVTPAGAPGQIPANQLALIPINVRVDANNNLQGTLGNVQFFYNSAFSRSETKYKYLALNVGYKVTNTLRVSAQASASDSAAFKNNIGVAGDVRQLRQTVTFDTTDPVFPSLSTTANLLDRATYQTNTGPAYSGGYREEDDRLKAARLVVDWDYDVFDVRGHFKAGVVYNESTKILETRATNNLFNGLTIPGVGLYGAATTTVAQRNAFITSFLVPIDTRNFVPGAPGTLPQAFLGYDKTFAYGTLDAVNVNRASALNLGSTYRSVETIKSAFVQSDFTGDLFGRRLRLNMGVRFVDTASDIDNNVLIGANFVPNTRKGGYQNWLPSVTGAYDLTDKLTLRAAVGKTFTRAAIQNIAASISLPAGGAGNLVLNAGNPDLQPEFATSLDGAVEWYFAPGGVLSAAAYKKTITGRAATASQFVPFNTLGIPSSIFTLNIQNDLAANPATLVEVRTPVNLDRYTLNGFEFAYQQQFRFLPAPFDGLGALASVTRVNTQGLKRLYPARVGNSISLDTNLPSTNPLLPAVILDLNDVPETTYQLGAYYEKGPVALRVSYNYKSEVASQQFSVQNIGFQRITNARGYLDATASYRIAKWLELRVDAANITNVKTYDFFRNVNGLYGDEQSRVEGAIQNGRVVTFGIRGAF